MTWRGARALGLGAALLAAACANPLEKIDFERMVDQPRGKPYGASHYFVDGRVMRAPPAGAIPVERERGPAARVLGIEGAAYTESLPDRPTRASLERGRNRFEVYCAACHGVLGDGMSVVAEHMSLRKPPSLVDDPIRSYPPGRIFVVVTDGYGLMPSYAAQLSVADRWAVVAYLRALGLSAHTELASLPDPLQERARKELE
jgi:mono/diheme cytochrome c family protein